VAAQALVDSAVSFCEDSLAIRQRLEPQKTYAGGAELDVCAPRDQAISRVLKVWLDGYEIKSTPAVSVSDLSQPNGLPRTYYSRQNNSELQILLYPVPDRVFDIDIEVALRPTRSATTFEDDLFDLWVEPIVAGALQRLYAIPDQSFSNAAAAQAQMATAIYMTRRARVEGSYGRVSGTVRVKGRPFA
jgi:hypothetical protein